MKRTQLFPQPNSETPTDLYRSYLIRFWRSHPLGELRVSLQNIQTGESTPFANVETLFAYLKEQATAPKASSGTESLQ